MGVFLIVVLCVFLYVCIGAFITYKLSNLYENSDKYDDYKMSNEYRYADFKPHDVAILAGILWFIIAPFAFAMFYSKYYDGNKITTKE